MKHILLLFFLILFSCKKEMNPFVQNKVAVEVIIEQQEKTIDYKKLFSKNTKYKSDGFDFPVGKPNATGYYNAQKFTINNHLGDDWNGVGGGNTDLGDSIYAIANGYISEAHDYEGGWGNVIRIVHHHKGKLYESLYAHCDTIITKQGDFVKKGEQIATIGNLNGYYLAHLHLELRDQVDLGIGGGYSEDTTGYLNPTEFIKKNR